MEPERRIAFCPHCWNHAHQRLIYHHETTEKSYDRDGNLKEDFDLEYYLAVCETCDHLLLYYLSDVYEGVESGEWNFDHAVLVWPPKGGLPEVVPESVRRCYQEAHRVKNIAPGAFAVQIRRALEALCDDRNAVQGSLQKRLEQLAFKGEIPPVLMEMTNVIRFLGNLGAHDSEVRVSPYDADVIDEFFHAVVDYVYVAPSKLETFRSRLQRFRKADSKQDQESGEAPESKPQGKPRIH